MKLTRKQKKMVKEAIGDGRDFPKFTSDPIVNHRVDMLVCDMPPWEHLSRQEQDLYYQEVEHARKMGEF